MAGQGRVAKRAFWRAAIRRQAESGLPVARFCRREGLHPVTFYGWRRKLEEGSTGRAGAAAEGRPVPGTPSLVPVRLLGAPERASAAVEVISPGGWVLRVQDDADTDNARRVLQLLQEIG
jgi:transposase-like protein